MNLAIDARSGHIDDTRTPFVNGAIGLAVQKYGARADSIDKLRAETVARRQDAIVALVGGKRADSDRYHFARDLEHIHREVLEEKIPLLNGMRLFPVANRIPIGARTHTVRRKKLRGKAAIYRAGMAIPRSSVAMDEESWPVRHIVDGFDLDYFDQQSGRFAGTNEYGDKLRAARRAIEERLNDIVFNGHAESKLYGVLTYPHMLKAVSSVAMYRGSGATVAQIIAELNRMINYQYERTSQVFAPDTLGTSPRIRNFLYETRMGDGSDKTIARWWLENNSRGIKAIEEAHELQGVGPGGTDAFLTYKNNSDAVAIEMVGGLVSMPGNNPNPFQTEYVAYQSTGGVTMRDTGHNVLWWVQGAP
jgi:hypothetical protein